MSLCFQHAEGQNHASTLCNPAEGEVSLTEIHVMTVFPSQHYITSIIGQIKNRLLLFGGT